MAVNVVVAVIKRNDKVFATQRGYGEFKGAKEALKREILEELNTDIEVGDLIDVIEYDYPTFHLSMKCYWCSIIKGSLELLEHDEAKWLGKEELSCISWLPADMELLDKIRREL